MQPSTPYTGGDSPLTSGWFRPVQTELVADELPVRGAVPRELRGSYLRNGMNPMFRPLTYALPYDGDGMIHALAFDDGRVSYRNRWVDTRELQAEKRAGRALYGGYGSGLKPVPADLAPGDPPGPNKNVSHTHVIHHAGRILSLHENGLPYELTSELDTVGPYDYGERVGPAMTAHPRIDSVTGELVFYRYWGERPYLHYYVADREGRITVSVPIEIPDSVVLHDFILTERHVGWVIGPGLLDARTRERVWRPELGTRIIVLPRDGDLAGLRTYTTEAFFVLHFMNTYEEYGVLVADYIRHNGVGRGAPPRQVWTERLLLDLASGRMRFERIDDFQSELPRIDDRRCGLPYRYGYQPVEYGGTLEYGSAYTLRRPNMLCQWDLERGTRKLHRFGANRLAGEAIFLPRPGGTGEDDGWVGTYVYNADADTSEFVLLAAGDIESEPVARIALPQRVPFGLHGSWVENWLPG